MTPAAPWSSDAFAGWDLLTAGSGWRVVGGIAVALIVARVARWLQGRLRPAGMLPVALSATGAVARIAAIVLGLAGLLQILPSALAPMVPWIAIAAAAAVGWSLRDTASDIVAGIVLAMERNVERGQWITVGDVSGTVEAVSWRATWLRDTSGGRVAVPNRELLAGVRSVDASQGVETRVRLTLDVELPSHRVRRALLEAALLAPWLAPDPDVRIHQDADAEGQWLVSVRVVAGRYCQDFAGSLRETVLWVLNSTSS